MADRLSTKVENGTTTTYSYDTTNQLTQDGANDLSYDGNGNWTMAGYATGAGNRTSTDGVWTYTYDAEGNVTKKSKGATSDTWTYDYDNNNQMTGATFSATDGGTVTQRTTYSYDAFANRIQNQGWDGATTTTQRYGLDGWDTARPPAIGDENFNAWADLNGSNILTDRRMFGTEFGAPVATETSAGAVSWDTTDLQGSVRLVLDNSGTITTTLAYDAFGKVVSGSPPDRYTYATMQRDSITGLYSTANGQRDDNPETGSWQQSDPTGFRAGDPNLRRYVGNDPTNFVDPNGYDGRAVNRYPGNDLLYRGGPIGYDDLVYRGEPSSIQLLRERSGQQTLLFRPDQMTGPATQGNLLFRPGQFQGNAFVNVSNPQQWNWHHVIPADLFREFNLQSNPNLQWNGFYLHQEDHLEPKGVHAKNGMPIDQYTKDVRSRLIQMQREGKLTRADLAKLVEDIKAGKGEFAKAKLWQQELDWGELFRSWVLPRCFRRSHGTIILP